MSRRGRRGNGHARHAQPVAEVAGDEPEDDIVVIEAETGNEVTDDEQPVHIVEPDREPEGRADPEADDEFSALQRQFDELKAQKETDVARLREYEARNAAQAQDMQASHKALLEHALLTAKGELTAAKRAFKEAMALSDYEAAAEAQEAIAEARLDARQYEMARDEFDRQAETAKIQTQQRRPANREELINAYMDQFTPTTRAWAEKHKDELFKSDARVNQAVALHHAAVAGGITPDTPDYFAYVEKGLGIVGDPVKTRRTPQERRPPMASAPVRGGSVPNARLEVPLTQAQRDTAARLGMTTAKYARYVDEIQKNQSNPNWRGPRFSAFDGQPKS